MHVLSSLKVVLAEKHSPSELLKPAAHRPVGESHALLLQSVY